MKFTVVIVTVTLAALVCSAAAASSLRRRLGMQTQARILPPGTTDRHGQDITGATYAMLPGTRAWHASDQQLNVQQLKTRPLWLGAYSSNALASGYKKATDNDIPGDTVYLHLFELNSKKPLTLLNLHQDSAANRDRLDPLLKEPFGPTMGNPSSPKFGPQLAPLITGSNLCKQYAGWRSAWDQNEFMLCPAAQSLALVATFTCDVKKIEAAVGGKPAVAASYTYTDAFEQRLVQEDKAMYKNARKFPGLKAAAARKDGGLRTFDMHLKGEKGILDLLKTGACTGPAQW
eukprot:TRINITY_DN43040_c0_g1_i1.p2 TRINITY_DN43040_c0_g1~~TRINITY_DN43040_c0_g1_i1.p2  ORF type:complete len:289 (-),score=115.64 TRINITY_DN43040_c0_g1_i1:221-1087(-)